MSIATVVRVGVSQVHEDFDARLAHIDPSKNVDYFYILQLLCDPTADGPAHYIFIRHGRTGTSGQGKLHGPVKVRGSRSRSPARPRARRSWSLIVACPFRARCVPLVAWRIKTRAVVTTARRSCFRACGTTTQ